MYYVCIFPGDNFSLISSISLQLLYVYASNLQISISVFMIISFINVLQYLENLMFISHEAQKSIFQVHKIINYNLLSSRFIMQYYQSLLCNKHSYRRCPPHVEHEVFIQTHMPIDNLVRNLMQNIMMLYVTIRNNLTIRNSLNYFPCLMFPCLTRILYMMAIKSTTQIFNDISVGCIYYRMKIMTLIFQTNSRQVLQSSICLCFWSCLTEHSFPHNLDSWFIEKAKHGYQPILTLYRGP